jgi:sulfate adenylyltransferase subunit 1 (EFTu-like GTPase family)
MLTTSDDLPEITKLITGVLTWMSQTPLRLNAPYLVKHTTKSLSESISRRFHRIDIEIFEQVPSETLRINETGLVQIETHKPMLCDRYSQNRMRVSFILNNRKDSNPVAAR